MKIGDKVRILTIPTDLSEGEIQTKSLFGMCVERIFSVVGFQGNLLELHVGEVKGKAPFMESIWIEPDHVEILFSRLQTVKKMRQPFSQPISRMRPIHLCDEEIHCLTFLFRVYNPP